LEEALLSEQIERYSCPYCGHDSVSPGGIKFHVRIKHRDKIEEFSQKHLPEMDQRYKKAQETD